MTSKAKKKGAKAAPESAFNLLVDETVMLYRRLNIVAEDVHHRGEMSGGYRGILRILKAEGPLTVPQMARKRAVSRQHIQMLVNRLATDNFVQTISNPANKRSPLVALTARGGQFVEEMDQREAKLLLKSELGLSEQQIREAAHSLKIIREFFESEAWRRTLKAKK